MMLTVSLSPHIFTRRTVQSTMWHVSLALLPATLTALWFFGVGAAAVLTTSIVVCMATEYAVTRWMLRRPTTVSDGAAFLTGLLLALNLPSNLPLWIVALGAVFAVGVGKMAFGGLGCNVFNPALVGRVFLLLSFPAQMTTWPLPGVNRLAWGADVVTGATPLSQASADAVTSATQHTEVLTHHSDTFFNLITGNIGGSMGEVGVIAILLGLVYMLWRRLITWHIPVSILVTAGLLSWVVGADPWVQLCSGGLMLGAVFMATDYVTSPMTRRGMLVYGVLIGVVTVVIRQWGAYPEGMSFAILLMNGATPLINALFKPRRYGEARSMEI